MLPAHLTSRVGRRLFIRFLLAAMLPMVGMALYTYFSVSQLLLDSEYQRLKQDSKSYGMSLIEGLNTHASLLQHLASNANPGSAIQADALAGFTDLVKVRADEMSEISPTERRHLAQGKPLLRLSLSEPSRLMLEDHAGNIYSGTIAARDIWKNDSAPEHYCVLDKAYHPLFCSPGLSPPAAAVWQQPRGNVNTGVFPWRVQSTEYLGAYWQANLNVAYDHPGFLILVASHKADALADLAFFRLVFPAIVLLALALAAGLAINQIRRQMQPLDRLNAGTRRLAGGDFDVVLPDQADDEFGRLGQAFNHMSEKLRYKFNMLNMLAELDRAILSASEMNYVVSAVLDHVLQAIPCDSAGLLRLEEDGKGVLLNVGKQPGEIRKSSLTVPDKLRNLDFKQGWLTLDLAQCDAECLASLSDSVFKMAYLFPIRIKDKLDSILILGFNELPRDYEEVVTAGISLADRLAVAASNMAWEEKLYHQAHYDALTDLPNRVLLRDRVEQAMLRSQRELSSTAAMLIDLDNFKQVNDSLGHSAGDALLIECARRLTALSRRSDTVVRLGGDEFLFLVPDLAKADLEATTISLANKISEALTAPISIAERSISVGASIGIAFYPENASSFEDLLKMADAAMYAAKRGKTDGISFYSREMNAAVQARFELIQELRAAIKNNEMLLYYQPKVEIASYRIVGAEALVRWNSPKRGLVPPLRFIPLLNEMGLGDWLGEWALNTACSQSMAWQSEGLAPVRLSVNIAPENFVNGSILELVWNALSRTGLNPDLLELEILEETTITSFQAVHSILAQLREKSVHVALDDFGTGYTSLVYLNQIPANVLKIDRAFISDLLTNQRQRTLLRHIIAMAKVLGFTIVVEGVEELAQMEILREMDCDIIQGYLFSKPVPADEFARLLRNGFIDPTSQHAQ